MATPAQVLSSLPLNHTLALTALSLAEMRWLARTPWERLCADVGIVDARGRAVSGAAFQQLAQDLVDVRAALHANNQFAVSPLFMAAATDLAFQSKRLMTLALRLPTNRWDHRSHAVRYLRLAVASGDDHDLARRLLASCPLSSPTAIADTRDHLLAALGIHAPSAWIARLPEAHRDVYLFAAAEACIVLGRAPDSPLLEHLLLSRPDDVIAMTIVLLAFKGDEGSVASLLARLTEVTPWSISARAFHQFVKGDLASARDAFDLLRRKTSKKRMLAPNVLGIFHALLVLSDERARDMDELHMMLNGARRDLIGGLGVEAALSAMAEFRRTGQAQELPFFFRRSETWLEEMMRQLTRAFVPPSPFERNLGGTEPADKRPEAIVTQVRAGGLPWLGDRLAEIAAGSVEPGSWLAMMKRRETWEYVLDTLDFIASARAAAASGDEGGGRLRWRLEKEGGSFGFRAEALYIAPGKRNEKKIAISRVASDDSLPLRDRRIAELIRVSSDFTTSRLPSSMLSEFVGHASVVDARGEPLRIERGQPELSVVEDGSGIRISLSPTGFEPDGAAVVRSAGTWTLVALSGESERLRSALGDKELRIPKRSRERLTRTLSVLGRTMAVRFSGAEAPPDRMGDVRPRVQLFRIAGGFRARLRVKPFGDSGDAFRPGVPPANVLFADGDVIVNGVRDLPGEQRAADALYAAAPTLASLESEGEDRLARDLQTCLELLMELRDAGASVEWPEGTPLRAPIARSAANIKFSVLGGATWLDVQGSLSIDEERVIDMRTLLAQASRAVGRFVPVGDGEFVALTLDIARKLEALGRAQELGGKQGISSALLPALGEWSDGFSVEWSAEVLARRDAIERAMVARPKLPRTLAAELRDYQRDGFVFLARRADAGLGAILADDMGLGKTVQALALLLHRASGGPALVVMPMSVARNWETEAARFAPTLRIHRVSELDREATVKKAGPRDVLLCSYGILVSEEELLASRRFHTVIYDEAHALKNPGTKRHAAARKIQSAATVALTGTPVENRPGELHAIVDVVLPAMLGSRAAFDRAFSSDVPEEQKRARGTLRSLVRPLVLRRTKAEVLTELPPKTEIVRTLPPSKEHLAFYEAVRRRAMERAQGAARWQR